MCSRCQEKTRLNSNSFICTVCPQIYFKNKQTVFHISRWIKMLEIKDIYNLVAKHHRHIIWHALFMCLFSHHFQVFQGVGCRKRLAQCLLYQKSALADLSVWVKALLSCTGTSAGRLLSNLNWQFLRFWNRNNLWPLFGLLKCFVVCLLVLDWVDN